MFTIQDKITPNCISKRYKDTDTNKDFIKITESDIPRHFQ
jgi:hypothetical protein